MDAWDIGKIFFEQIPLSIYHLNLNYLIPIIISLFSTYNTGRTKLPLGPMAPRWPRRTPTASNGPLCSYDWE